MRIQYNENGSTKAIEIEGEVFSYLCTPVKNTGKFSCLSVFESETGDRIVVEESNSGKEEVVCSPEDYRENWGDYEAYYGIPAHS